MTTAASAAAILARYLPRIQAALPPACTSVPGLLGVMLRYHLGWADHLGAPIVASSGKRLRPALLLLAAEAAGGTVEAAMPAAVAVELLHNFSLIHDDIQDRSPHRHGRPTVWTVWGDAQAINAGDALHVQAQRALLDLPKAGVPLDRALIAMDRFTAAAARLCEGQTLDLAFEQRENVGLDEYLTMIRGKTAALIACALELGTLCASPDPTLWATYHAIGADLGVAFQIWDDYLGIWGDSAVTGKPVAEDIVNRKKSFPVAYAFERASGDDRDMLTTVYAGGPPDSGAVQAILALFDRLAVREYTQTTANEYIDRALSSLAVAPGIESLKQDLAVAAQSLVGRDH